ncbi:MAG: phosphatidate cytidylyltransferase [Azospira sp.]|jgi:phosphatidate cytidylyltransferase|nr:phosphatidate cytidylyltransferase [Azospira sp.]
MLRTRIVTALALLAGLLPALFLLPPLVWAWLIAVVAGLAAWEWGGFMRLGGSGRAALGAGCFLLCAAAILGFPEALGGEGWSLAVAWELGRWLYLPALIFWVFALPLWLRQRWPLPGFLGGLAVGAVVLLPTCLALVQLRQLGPAALLATMAVVWAADVAAYFAGRAFGRRKLAPNISPGKTWAGVWGAVAGVLVYGFAAAGLLPEALQRGGLPFFALALVALTALSVVGDLFESLLKRQAGIKDSSNLLPGHGGILDRIDSQTSTLPFVALLWLFLS